MRTSGRARKCNQRSTITRSNRPAADRANPKPLVPELALHRRLLDQLGRMRLEVPPICRLTAANRANRNQRLLADMEDRLGSIASKVSIGTLAPALVDPLLKIEEVSRWAGRPSQPAVELRCRRVAKPYHRRARNND